MDKAKQQTNQRAINDNKKSCANHALGGQDIAEHHIQKIRAFHLVNQASKKSNNRCQVEPID